MPASYSVIFADLTGSTAAFETLGNERATLVVTRLTQLMGETCALHNGRVVKTLGDGVLALFEPSAMRWTPWWNCKGRTVPGSRNGRQGW